MKDCIIRRRRDWNEPTEAVAVQSSSIMPTVSLQELPQHIRALLQGKSFDVFRMNDAFSCFL